MDFEAVTCLIGASFTFAHLPTCVICIPLQIIHHLDKQDKAFTELQAKVIDTQQKVKLADIQIEQLNRTKKHAHLTDTEIMTLVDETRMYEGVGRMFILQSKGVIHNQLLEKQKIAEEKIKELEQRKSYLERSVKDAEDNIREMLMARRAQ
ncbi:prefoldin subunit 1 isoform X1 [Mauremys reevesii]|uniref:prefoldin subunit 1 isoform X1 n=1 Tax=Mauremys reevesii TaxID=260615 RepID=UPI00193FD14B|nr:prefoldin subunit 1 isoform X1 [Mauremys reevesii]